MAVLDLEGELDRLYTLPLPEFVTARNELTKRLRADHDRQAADKVKALAKPSVTAWAVNILFHHERRHFDELLEAATAVRAALAGKGDRRKADAARRKALQALLGRAAKILAVAGHAVTPANRQRISHTLEVLAARDPAADGPRPGRLVADLEPQGFDVLAGLAASLAPASQTATPAHGPVGRPGGQTAAAPSAASARQKRLTAARQKVAAQQAAVDRLERQLKQAEDAAAEASDRHALLVEEAAEAEQRARLAAEAAAAAKKGMAAARAASRKAKADRRRGLSRLATARRQLENRRD